MPPLFLCLETASRAMCPCHYCIQVTVSVCHSVCCVCWATTALTELNLEPNEYQDMRILLGCARPLKGGESLKCSLLGSSHYLNITSYSSYLLLTLCNHNYLPLRSTSPCFWINSSNLGGFTPTIVSNFSPFLKKMQVGIAVTRYSMATS